MPALISVLGRDAAGDYLLAHWAATGSPVEHILRVDDPTPTLCAIINRGDDLWGADVKLLAVSHAAQHCL